MTPSPAKPASHRQGALPAAELESGGHAAQLIEPDSLVYLPAGQSVHCVAAEVLEYLPGSHAEQTTMSIFWTFSHRYLS